MSDKRVESRVGSLVWVDQVPDRNGSNLKCRLCLVLKDLDGGYLLACAATSQFDAEDIQYEEIELRPSGNPNQPSRIGLTKRTVVRCDWLLIVNADGLGRHYPPIGKSLAKDIAARVRDIVAANKHRLVRNDLA